jgi:hypothetical protein
MIDPTTSFKKPLRVASCMILDAGCWILDAPLKLLRVARCELRVKANKHPGPNTVIPVKTGIQPKFLLLLYQEPALSCGRKSAGCWIKVQHDGGG